jgi:hypothetical protein
MNCGDLLSKKRSYGSTGFCIAVKSATSGKADCPEYAGGETAAVMHPRNDCTNKESSCHRINHCINQRRGKMLVQGFVAHQKLTEIKKFD